MAKLFRQNALLLLCLGVLGLGSAQLAHAQAKFHVGPRLGYNLSTVAYQATGSGGTSSSAYRSGLAAGLEASFSWGRFSLQPAVVYSQQGFKLTQVAAATASYYAYTTTANNRLDYLAVPVNLLLTTKPGGEGGQVFAGPYVRLLLGGHQAYSDRLTYPNGQVLAIEGDAAVKAGDSFASSPSDNAYYSRRWDAGLQAGIGYRYQVMQLQAAYSLGLRNLGATYPGFPSAPTYKNRTFQVALTYLFSFAN